MKTKIRNYEFKPPAPPKQHPRLRSPVSLDLLVNVIFEGEGKITTRAIDATIAYLQLWRKGLEWDESNVQEMHIAPEGTVDPLSQPAPADDAPDAPAGDDPR